MSVQTEAELFAMTMERAFETLKKAKGGWFSGTTDFALIAKFIIGALDEAIKYAQEHMTDGKEKKEFVLTVLSRLYDTTVAPILPMWAWPFSSSIKGVIINTIISHAIDWIVQKYKDGIWNINPPQEEKK